MVDFSLRCFGVGDGWPCPDRNHSSYLYRFGKVSLLIDCGEPINSRLAAAGVDGDEIDGVLISHMHCDHIGGLFMLMQSWWLQKRRKDVRIHLPGYAIDPLRQMLQATYTFEELFAGQILYEPLKAAAPFDIEDVRVTPYPTTHLEQFRTTFAAKYAQPFEAFSFLFETKQSRIAHSGDIGAVEDLASLLKEPVDLLVCELAHVQPDELFRYLNGHRIKRIIFVHLARCYWESLNEIRSLATDTLKDMTFSFARDGDEFTLA